MVKIADLGISREIDVLEETMSSAGTPIYSAPEILDHQYSDKVDVWSLGVIYFELLNAKLPFNDARNLQDLRVIHNQGKFELPIKELNLTKQGYNWFSHCLAYDPNKRASAKEL